MQSNNRVSRRTVLGHVAVGTAGAMMAGNLAMAETPATKPAKGRIRQSVSKWCYGKMSMDELAQHCARIGYQSIELVGPSDWPIAKKHGLTCAMVPGAGTLPDCLNRRENHDRCEAEFRKNIALAAEAGMPNVICFSGNRNGISQEEGIRNCIDGIKRVIGYAEKMKVNICMEYLNSKVNHKDYQFDNMAFGVAVAKAVGSPRFGILYDIYHAQIMEGDIIRTIQENHQYILHYHTGGNPGRNEIDETQEIYYPAIMRAIVETGYKGFVGQEFVPARDPVEALENAFRICDV